MTEIIDADGTVVARLSDAGEWEWLREDLATAELVALSLADLDLVDGATTDDDVMVTTVEPTKPGTPLWADAVRSRLPWVIPDSWPLPTYESA